MSWYVLYTQPRHEDPVTFRLQNIGIEVLRLEINTKNTNIVKSVRLFI
jgi:hypothetical protein